MASNCLAPGYIRIDYTSNGNPHSMTIPVIPDSVGPNFALRTKAGSTVSQPTGVEALVTLLLPFFKSPDVFTGWEAFTQADCASPPVFQNANSMSGMVGTAGGADYPWTQAVFTFKTAGGGKAKLQLMEGGEPPDIKVPITDVGSSPADLLVAYLIGTGSWVVGRDNRFLNVPLNLVTKINDTLRKKFLNP